jgi:hypothetical protein
MRAERHTRMNIHDQPALPRVPFIFRMAAANKPENAPERVEARKNVDILVWSSCRG